MILRALLIAATLLATGCTTARNAVQFGYSDASGDDYEDSLFHLSVASYNPPGEEYSYFVERIGFLYEIGIGIESPTGTDYTDVLGEGGAPGDAAIGPSGNVFGFTVAPTFMPTDWLAVMVGTSLWSIAGFNEFRDDDLLLDPEGRYYVENDDSFAIGLVIGMTVFFSKESGFTATLQYDSAFDAPGFSVGWSF